MNNHRAFRTAWLLAATAGVFLGSIWVGSAGAEVPSRLKRQISVLEEVIDEVLIESPFLLIYGGDPTHGIYLEDFGVVFTLEASLVDKEWDWKEFPWLHNKYKIESEDGKIIIYREDNKDDEIVIDGDAKVKDWLEQRLDHEQATYEEGKTELLDVLADYGETLTGLEDNQWVAIAAFLKDSEYFSDRKISRMILKVKMADLRAHAQDRLSRADLMARIQEEEY